MAATKVGVSKGLPKQADGDEHYAALDFADVPDFIIKLRASDVPETTRLAFEPVALRPRSRSPIGRSKFFIAAPGRSAKKPLSNMVFLMALRRMGIESTAHGFRSAFRDWASERTNFRARFVNRPSPIRLRTKPRPHTAAATYSTRGAS
jgi:hypothetical protein